MYEHMMRIPLSIRIPGVTGPKETDYQWVNVDTVPTLLDLAGAKAIETHGQSAVPLLKGQSNQEQRDYVIGQYYGKQTWVNPIRTIRTKEWKYNLYTDWGEELYHLKDDPNEISNLAENDHYSAVKSELRETLDQWMKDHEDPFYSFTTTELDRKEASTILRGNASEGS